MIAAPPKPTDQRRRAVLRSRGGAQPFATSLQTLNRQPQGSPQIDSQTYPDECDPTHPFHFDFFLSTNILLVNRVLLSFFLRAFRRTLASVNTVTSGASSAASSGASSNTTSTAVAHFHGVQLKHGLAADETPGYNRANGLFTTSDTVDHTAATLTDGSHTHDDPHTHNIPHTHDVTPTLVDGIWEGAVATGVTVKVNGVDRTAALGGPGGGFTTNQTELALLVAWLNLGQWNTIDLTPTGLGRITGHLTVVSYIQSA
jgi:hypothetical protein